VAVGLAWTAVGGDVLFIEAAAMPGKGTLKVTGHLGEVMGESANLALAYVRHRAADLGIDAAWFESHHIHLHFPAGAVKKDGPSAGITVTTALVSLITGRPIAPWLAMTGEITLRGEVLPVGGVREKVIAARRAGIKTVIVPARNQADIEEIPLTVREKIRFVFAQDFAEVMAAALPSPKRVKLKPAASKGRRRTPMAAKKTRSRIG
jgi:ATP-dependent Lon protease